MCCDCAHATVKQAFMSALQSATRRLDTIQALFERYPSVTVSHDWQTFYFHPYPCWSFVLPRAQAMRPSQTFLRVGCPNHHWRTRGTATTFFRCKLALLHHLQGKTSTAISVASKGIPVLMDPSASHSEQHAEPFGQVAVLSRHAVMHTTSRYIHGLKMASS